MKAARPGAGEPQDQPDEDAARAAALNEPMRRLRAGEITAREADAAWAAADVLPYPKALPGGLPTLSWSLPLALAWIATRRLDLMEAVALRAQFHRERVASEPAEDGWAMDLSTSRGHLEAALTWGEITALGRRTGEDGARAVPAEAWSGLAVGFGDGSVALDGGLRELAPACWHEIRLRPAEVMGLWPTVSGETNTLVEVPSPLRLPVSEAGPKPAEPPPHLAEEASRAVAPTSRAGRRGAKVSAVARAKLLIADAPAGMLLPKLRSYIKEREPSLSRADIDGIKGSYPHLRLPGENARTRAFRKSIK